MDGKTVSTLFKSVLSSILYVVAFRKGHTKLIYMHIYSIIDYKK